MSAGDVVAVVAATVVTLLVAVLATVLVLTTRTLRRLRATLTVLEDDALAILDEARASVRDATSEVDRVERLVTSAERLDEAKRAIATPVVKAMAFGTGVTRAAQRLRDGDPGDTRAPRARSRDRTDPTDRSGADARVPRRSARRRKSAS